MRRAEMVHWQTDAGPTVSVGGLAVTPQARALVIRLRSGGFVWNRPVAVLVERGGRVERIPIHDVTGMVQLGLFGLSLIFALILLTSARQRRNRND